METLVDAPKQEERKFNLHFIGLEAKEGETQNELVQRFNTELLEGQMRLHTKVITATWQQPTTVVLHPSNERMPQCDAIEIRNE